MLLKKEYPQHDFERAEWLNLNGTWDFSFDAPTFEQKIEVPYPWGSPLSGISDSKNGTGYYRRTVSWNPQGERIILRFGAVDSECTVQVNGREAGGHVGGYCAFGLDVTDLWKRDGENEIIVAATDDGERNRAYGKQGYGDARGIWQTVWLETRPAAYIASFFTQTKLDGTVTISAETVNVADGTEISAVFGGNTAVATVTDNTAVLVLNMENPHLWSVDDPYLYEGTVTCGKDTVSTYFGIREIGTGKFGANKRNWITLNGKPIYLCGTLDQSFNPNGFFTLPSDEDCREEIVRLKRIGVNMARIHIKAEEPLKLYWADKLGLLIMEDIPCFWTDPIPATRERFEREMEEQILRDRNHPAIFYWVIFNETWGLFDHFTEEYEEADPVPAGETADNFARTIRKLRRNVRAYTANTAEWVVKCFQRAKELDPTRLVEDNSPCNRDHTVTDVNTWHFYSNGYERVKNVVESFCKGAYVGSQQNYKEGYTMQDVPCMNSECGAVWGLKGNAGESDISWQYKYMMNEFRLHDLLCGFVFTEFHDVVNEFNGYYKLNNGDKDFGYKPYGFTLNDLHTQDYLGADFPPMKTVKAGEEISVPMFGSSFSDKYHGKTLTVSWQLAAQDPVNGSWLTDSDEYNLYWADYGTFPAGNICFTVPQHDGVLVLQWELSCGEEVITRNALLFDVDGERADALTLAPADFTAEGWKRSFTAQQGEKLNGLGSGSFSVTVKTADIPNLAEAKDLRLLCEISTRMPMTHDFPDTMQAENADTSYMLGYRCDPGANPNSFVQTDDYKNGGFAEVLIDGTVIERAYIADCPADSRGCLSAHYQPVSDMFDEMATYGQVLDITVPSALLFKLKEKESFTLTFRTADNCGLSLFGRRSGGAGIGVVLIAD